MHTSCNTATSVLVKTICVCVSQSVTIVSHATVLTCLLLNLVILILFVLVNTYGHTDINCS